MRLRACGFVLGAAEYGAAGASVTGAQQQNMRRGIQLRKLRSLTIFAAAGALGIIVAACGNSTSTSTSGNASVPSGLSISSFDSSFSIMSQLKGLTSAGTGLVGVILPDTTSSTRYVNFDLP